MDPQAIDPAPDARRERWPTPDAFVHGEPVTPPGTWGRPGLVFFFNLECAGCVSRGVPFLKQLARTHGEALEVVAIHTAYGHRRFPEADVAPQVQRFGRGFARLASPIALDLDGSLAEAWGVEGTPHWLAFDAEGALVRSIYGSQENAQTRLGYLLDELVASAGPAS